MPIKLENENSVDEYKRGLVLDVYRFCRRKMKETETATCDLKYVKNKVPTNELSKLVSTKFSKTKTSSNINELNLG